MAGCTLASSGCSNCYAMRMAARLQAMGHLKYLGTTRKSGDRYVWTGKVNIDEASLSAPLEWRKPKRIFVNSMSDLFHPDVPSDFIRRVWEVMLQSTHHHFQILTKRPERMSTMFDSGILKTSANIWLGTSVENADVADRVKHLSRIKNSTLFISFEPLVGPITDLNLRGIHWAIVGGESGPRARPMEEAWVERLFEMCRRDDVAFFFKQWGGRNKKATGRHLHGRTYDEFPLTLETCA
nr:DUF5131 family protein [Tardibacter chloracetimidivorans]